MKNSEYDQEISQSQTADKPVAQRGRATQQSQDTMMTNKANQLSLPHQIKHRLHILYILCEYTVTAK